MKTWKQNIFGIVAIMVLVFTFTVCDNGNKDPVCTCPAGTLHADGVPCCNGTDCTCGIDPKTVNIAPADANIKIYNHSSTPTADLPTIIVYDTDIYSFAEYISLVHNSIIQAWEQFPEYLPLAYGMYASYGNNIIVNISDTGKIFQLNGQTLNIFFNLTDYNFASQDFVGTNRAANNVIDFLLYGAGYGMLNLGGFADGMSLQGTIDFTGTELTQTHNIYEKLQTVMSKWEFDTRGKTVERLTFKTMFNRTGFMIVIQTGMVYDGCKRIGNNMVFHEDWLLTTEVNDIYDDIGEKVVTQNIFAD